VTSSAALRAKHACLRTDVTATYAAQELIGTGSWVVAKPKAGVLRSNTHLHSRLATLSDGCSATNTLSKVIRQCSNKFYSVLCDDQSSLNAGFSVKRLKVSRDNCDPLEQPQACVA
jgi:hypothetical protein